MADGAARARAIADKLALSMGLTAGTGGREKRKSEFDQGGRAAPGKLTFHSFL